MVVDRELIRDYNRLPHWAHHLRQDGRRSPLAVLGDAKGKQVEPADLEGAGLHCATKRASSEKIFPRRVHRIFGSERY
jgi:hypothetical protein